MQKNLILTHPSILSWEYAALIIFFIFCFIFEQPQLRPTVYLGWKFNLVRSNSHPSRSLVNPAKLYSQLSGKFRNLHMNFPLSCEYNLAGLTIELLG